jgi:hypothetical protein
VTPFRGIEEPTGQSWLIATAEKRAAKAEQRLAELKSIGKP